MVCLNILVSVPDRAMHVIVLTIFDVLRHKTLGRLLLLQTLAILPLEPALGWFIGGRLLLKRWEEARNAVNRSGVALLRRDVRRREIAQGRASLE